MDEKSVLASAPASVMEMAKKACEENGSLMSVNASSLSGRGKQLSKEWYEEHTKWREHGLLVAVDRGLDYVYNACDDPQFFAECARLIVVGCYSQYTHAA
jgi:hypothetical protein